QLHYKNHNQLEMQWLKLLSFKKKGFLFTFSTIRRFFLVYNRLFSWIVNRISALLAPKKDNLNSIINNETNIHYNTNNNNNNNIRNPSSSSSSPNHQNNVNNNTSETDKPIKNLIENWSKDVATSSSSATTNWVQMVEHKTNNNNNKNTNNNNNIFPNK